MAVVPANWIPALFGLSGVVATLVTQRVTALMDAFKAGSAANHVADVTDDAELRRELWKEIGALREQGDRQDKELEKARNSERDCLMRCARMEWDIDMLRIELGKAPVAKLDDAHKDSILIT